MLSSYLVAEKIADLHREADRQRRARAVTPKPKPRKARGPWTARLRRRFALV